MSLLKSDSKLSSIKTEAVSPTKQNESDINKNSVYSAIPSSSKTGSFKTETPTSSCYESAVNAATNREPCDALSSYMKNAILEEVLNAKKAALLQSPAVMKVLREEQLKKQRRNWICGSWR